jgi:hypothetical protein
MRYQRVYARSARVALVDFQDFQEVPDIVVSLPVLKTQHLAEIGATPPP